VICPPGKILGLFENGVALPLVFPPRFRHDGRIMAQAIMDPEEVRRFAVELKRFNEDVQSKASSLQARFAALGSTWQDQEQTKFAEEFISTMKVIKKFVEVSEKHTPFLLRKAARIEEYLTQR
jgi:uncharacterized protein YukE